MNSLSARMEAGALARMEAGALAPMESSVSAPMAGVVYPPAGDLQRYLAAGILTRETLAGAFCQALETHGDRVAYRGPEGTLTFRDLDSLTDRAAAALIHAGLRAGDRILFQLPNSSHALIAVIGCFKAGLIPVATLASHREIEIVYLGRHSGARAHIVPAADPKFDFQGFARSMREQVPTLGLVLVVGGPAGGSDVDSLDALIEGEDPRDAKRLVREHVASLDPFQVAMFQLSGGTTSVPKIIPRFQNEYLYNMRACGAAVAITGDDAIFYPGPLLHNAPMVVFWGPALLAGGAVVVFADLSPAGFAASLARESPTILFAPPPVLPLLKAALGQLASMPAQLRLLVVPHAALATQNDLGVPAVTLFGMTEGVIMIADKSDPEDALAVTTGRPVSAFDEVRILAPGGETEVAEGEVGELAIKGPYTISGYYDAAERNREAFTADGFYRSGDLMSARRIDGRIFYAFEGRLKDVVCRAGEKINCEEVERLMRALPGVRDVLLVPVPDPLYDERGCACFIMAPDAAVPSLEALGAFLGEAGLAKFKWPERIETFTGFPITKSAKPNKAALTAIVIERQSAR